MIMEVRYLGSVRTTTGERQIQWEKPATTLRELLRDLDGADTPLHPGDTISVASKIRLQPAF